MGNFWALARDDRHPTWMLLDKDAGFVTDVSGLWGCVKTFRTRAQAVGWEFFIRVKHPNAFENIRLKIVRVEIRPGRPGQIRVKDEVRSL